MPLTNDNVGTIKAEHKKEIVAVFGSRGKKIAQTLAENPSATMLGELFKNFAK